MGWVDGLVNSIFICTGRLYSRATPDGSSPGNGRAADCRRWGGPQWGHPLTLLTGSPDWSEYNWLSDMLISFPGCRVPEPITPITEGSNADLPELQTVWFSAPHIISHPSIRCLNNPGPWSTLPTPSHSSEPHPGDSFLKHSVCPSSPPPSQSTYISRTFLQNLSKHPWQTPTWRRERGSPD